MTRPCPGFDPSNTIPEGWYDLREDWELIEASFAKQYNIRIRQQTDMPWPEFATLLSGLMPDTPLGAVVGIRAETDPAVIERFNANQKRIYNEWEAKRANKLLDNPEELDKSFDALAQALAGIFGGGNQ